MFFLNASFICLSKIQTQKIIIENDTIIRIDTIIKSNEWEKKDYYIKKNKKGFFERKIIYYNKSKIEIQQNYLNKKEIFINKSIMIDDSSINLYSLYKKTYNSRFNNKLYFMENIVTAKYYADYLSIDLLLAQHNCLGSFCNDVVILTIRLNNNGKISVIFHDEDFAEYSL